MKTNKKESPREKDRMKAKKARQNADFERDGITEKRFRKVQDCNATMA